MKTISYCLRSTLLVACLVSFSLNAQDQELPFVEVTTTHWNMDLEDFSMEEWREVEKEYHEKVIMKNEHILSAMTLMHHFTSDNSEVLLVTVYSDWNAIDEASKRNDELIMEAWPDEAERKAFLRKQAKFYTNEHADEIYRAFPGAKYLNESDIPLIFYVRTSYLSFTEEGTDEEFLSLFNEFNEAATYKNEHYRAYYPQLHFYGADRREFVEVFVTENLAQLEKGITRQSELFRDYMPDEDERNEFDKKYNKYFTGVHNDRIYSSVPELFKDAPRD